MGWGGERRGKVVVGVFFFCYKTSFLVSYSDFVESEGFEPNSIFLFTLYSLASSSSREMSREFERE